MKEDIKTIEEDKIKCPFCGKEKTSREIICMCEVEDSGMDEFWKN